MRFILKTVCVCCICLFFTLNIYAQTTKNTLQTFCADKTVQIAEILTKGDTKYIVDTWSGDFIMIHVEVEAEGIDLGSINEYKAKCEQKADVLTIKLDKGQTRYFKDGKEVRINVKYEIFIPEKFEYQ